MYDTGATRGSDTTIFIGKRRDAELEWNLAFYKVNFINYWWYGLYVMLYLGIIVYLLRYGSKEKKQIFVVPFFILLFTVFEPFFMEPILSRTGDWRDRYSRFFWMLPVEFLVSYTLVSVMEHQEKKETKTLLLLFVTCLIFLGTGSATELEFDDNIYKVDNSVIAVAEMIERVSKKKQPNVIYDEELYYWIRQYDPALISAVKPEEMKLYLWVAKDQIDLKEQYQNDGTALSMFARGVEVDAEIMNRAIREREIDFLVRNTEFYSAEYLSQLNIEYVDMADGYELYRCLQE